MTNSRRPGGNRRFLHILMGEPDDKCEICRAHGFGGHEFPEPSAPGVRIVDMNSLDEILSCSCPLCAQIQFESFEDERGEDPEAPGEE